MRACANRSQRKSCRKKWWEIEGTTPPKPSSQIPFLADDLRSWLQASEPQCVGERQVHERQARTEAQERTQSVNNKSKLKKLHMEVEELERTTDATAVEIASLEEKRGPHSARVSPTMRRRTRNPRRTWSKPLRWRRTKGPRRCRIRMRAKPMGTQIGLWSPEPPAPVGGEGVLPPQ